MNSFQYNMCYYFHILICFLVITIPFWKKCYLKIGIFVPFLISLIWIVFDDCPLSKLHNMNNNTFTLSIYKNIIPNITEKQNNHMNTSILLAITLLTFFALFNFNCKNLNLFIEKIENTKQL